MSVQATIFVPNNCILFAYSLVYYMYSWGRLHVRFSLFFSIYSLIVHVVVAVFLSLSLLFSKRMF